MCQQLYKLARLHAMSVTIDHHFMIDTLQISLVPAGDPAKETRGWRNALREGS
jgi:hypothetical protein